VDPSEAQQLIAEVGHVDRLSVATFQSALVAADRRPTISAHWFAASFVSEPDAF